ALRHVDKVDLIGWSMGGPRAGGYAAQHPDKISKMVLLAPAYGGGGRGAAPSSSDGAPARGNSAGGAAGSPAGGGAGGRGAGARACGALRQEEAAVAPRGPRRWFSRR